MADQTVVQQVGFAPQVAPYAERLLGKAEALTDTTKNPYMSYAEYAKSRGLDPTQVAGFQDLQVSAMDRARNLGVDPSMYLSGMGLASLAQQAASTQYDPGQFSGGVFGTQEAAQYMSPYLRMALAPQIEEAQRQAGIASTQQAGQAVKSGAFGGARYGLQQAELQRNLGQTISNIVGQGYNTAFGQAQQQFNQDMARRMQAQQLGEQSRQYGAGLGLQGLQAGMGAYGQLAGVGQNIFGQQQQGIQTQQQLGQMQQQQAQAELNVPYQDYLAFQNYPYKQLQFMSDVTRGTPTSVLGSSMYQAAPSMFSQIAGAGTALLGANTLSGNKLLGLGGAEGGLPRDFKKAPPPKKNKAPMGLQALALSQM